jgi:hypothetical protein
MRWVALVVFLAATSSSMADDLTAKGLVSDSTGSVHNLTDVQCWRAVDNYQLYDANGQARIEEIATQCRAQLQGKSRPTGAIAPSGDRALQPMAPMVMPQAVQPMTPPSTANIIAPRQPAQ